VTIATRIALIYFTSLLWIPSTQANQQEDLEKLRLRISSLQQDIEKTFESKSEAADALRESERAISNSNRELYKIKAQQREANITLNQFQQQSKQISGDMQEQQLQLAKLLHQQYLGGKQEYFKLLLGNQDPNQVARELQYYEYIAQSRAIWLKNMRTNLTKLNAVASQVKQKNSELTALQAEQTTQQQNLLKIKNTHLQLLNKISLQLKQQKKEIGRLQKDENRLSSLLEKLTHIVAQPKPSSPQTTHITAPGKHTPPLQFAKLKGKLPLPVAAKISNKFGGKRPDSPILWKGYFLQTAASQPVYAIAAGQVIYADWLRGFGNLLIIDHGQGYMSLYGNNEALYKQVGDELQSGDTIASVGNSGGNENYGLYFELRHEGIPLDPAKWVTRRAFKAR
jgi:septal ring factor EnvC (AmiA/AmiB activator)